MNKLPVNTLEQLTALVKRVETDRKYMAWALSAYQHKERLSREKFLEKLDISHEHFLRLALCLYPESESLNFHGQVQQISAYCNVDASVIVNIIRHVEALEALSSQSARDLNSNPQSEHPGVFAAARDSEAAEDILNLIEKDMTNDIEDDNEVE